LFISIAAGALPSPTFSFAPDAIEIAAPLRPKRRIPPTDRFADTTIS
jgi:hypothetical protein